MRRGNDAMRRAHDGRRHRFQVAGSPRKTIRVMVLLTECLGGVCFLGFAGRDRRARAGGPPTRARELPGGREPLRRVRAQPHRRKRNEPPGRRCGGGDGALRRPVAGAGSRCAHSRGRSLHHLDPRCEGGAHDPHRLAVLCGAHHRAVHLGLLCVDGDGATGFVFHHGDGTPYGGSVGVVKLDLVRQALVLPRRWLRRWVTAWPAQSQRHGSAGSPGPRNAPRSAGPEATPRLRRPGSAGHGDGPCGWRAPRGRFRWPEEPAG